MCILTFWNCIESFGTGDFNTRLPFFCAICIRQLVLHCEFSTQAPTDRPATAIREQRISVFYHITVSPHSFCLCLSVSLSLSDSLHLSVLWKTEAVLTAEGSHTLVTDRNPNLRLNLMGRVVTACYCAHAPNWNRVVFTSAPQSGEMERRKLVEILNPNSSIIYFNSVKPIPVC